MNSLLVMSMLVISLRDVIGGRNGLFRPPVLDTSPWHPVGRSNFNLSKQSAKHPVETTRLEKLEKNGNDEKLKRKENSAAVDIRENIILDIDSLIIKKINQRTTSTGEQHPRQDKNAET
jgi:hypothetical protein